MNKVYVVTHDDFLMHHGVKKQKWGVRRYQNKDGSLTPLGRAHLKDPSVTGGAGGGSAKKDDKGKKEDQKNTEGLSDKEIAKYSNDVTRGSYGNWQDRVNNLKNKGLSANDIIKIQGKVNESFGVKDGASKEFQALVKRSFKSSESSSKTKTTSKKADKKSSTSKKANKSSSKSSNKTKKTSSSSSFKKAFTGGVKTIKKYGDANKKKYIKHYADEEELMHYGIMGMKWGRRRYQNEDGSLTSAGRAHYGVKGERKVSDSESKAAKKAAKAEAKENKKAAKAEAKEARKVRREKAARDRRMKTGPGAASEAVNMDEKDVREYISKYRNANELMKERSILDTYIDKYSPKEPSKLEKAVEVAAKAASIAESMGRIKTAVNTISGRGKPLSSMDKADLALKREKIKTDQQNRRIALQNFLSKQKTEAQNRSIAAATHKSKMSDAELARKMSSINVSEKLYEFSQKKRSDAAREQTVKYVNSLSDYDIASATDRYRRENDALDFLFKYKK